MSETISPTIERDNQATFGIDGPEVGQKTERRAFAVRDIWQDLRRRSQINDEEMEAGKKFARHYELAYRGRRITPTYGTGFAEGTPLSQLATSAEEEQAAREIDYVRLHQEARDILNMSARQAVIYASDGKTLEHIGLMVAGYRDRDKAVAAGYGFLKSALECLVIHYNTRRRDPYP